MTTEPPRRRSADQTEPSSARLIGLFLLVAVAVALALTIGAITADPDYRVLLKYLAIFSAMTVFALAGLYAVRSERRSSDIWRTRLATTGAPGNRDWVGGTLAFKDFTEELRREISRSRRSSRPCSVLLLKPSSVSGFDDSTVQVFTLDRVADTFRTTDLFAHAPTLPGVIVMLPETNGEGAAIAAERLRRDAAAFEMRRGDGTTTPLEVRVTAVTYPEDATDDAGLLGQLGLAIEATPQ